MAGSHRNRQVTPDSERDHHKDSAGRTHTKSPAMTSLNSNLNSGMDSTTKNINTMLERTDSSGSNISNGSIGSFGSLFGRIARSLSLTKNVDNDREKERNLDPGKDSRDGNLEMGLTMVSRSADAGVSTNATTTTSLSESKKRGRSSSRSNVNRTEEMQNKSSSHSSAMLLDHNMIHLDSVHPPDNNHDDDDGDGQEEVAGSIHRNTNHNLDDDSDSEVVSRAENASLSAVFSEV
eukprot:TRINITY_DN3553_c0_g1::TRINITY_DN3553_c0_g1_i1::g.18128::m.18128 TRINITY_DN3553_c0_g1::TRINITY_DN3553_c0_g1_i1::g.18128  ORF type:complete len:247 (+),score=11.95 TRINITY_DN3553_c0_g1_i1:37-741(+)